MSGTIVIEEGPFKGEGYRVEYLSLSEIEHLLTEKAIRPEHVEAVYRRVLEIEGYLFGRIQDIKKELRKIKEAEE